MIFERDEKLMNPRWSLAVEMGESCRAPLLSGPILMGRKRLTHGELMFFRTVKGA